MVAVFRRSSVTWWAIVAFTMMGATAPMKSIGVEAFAAGVGRSRHRLSSTAAKRGGTVGTATTPHSPSQSPTVLFSKRGNEGPGMEDVIRKRLDRADPQAIVQDAAFVACFVLCRYLAYDASAGTRLLFFGVEDVVQLTGTFSSAALLGMFWTASGLATRVFEGRWLNSPLANAVTVAVCCPSWIVAEHLMRFGPPDIGGPTLDASIASGFVGLASFMVVMKPLMKTLSPDRS